MLQRTAGSACFSLPMSRLYPRGESATLRAELSEEGMQMKKQLRGLFCAAVLAAMLALPEKRRMAMKQSTVSMRIRIENLCIGIIFLFSLMLFALSFFHRSSAEAAVLVSTEMGWMVQRAVSVLLFCLVSQPKKRKRAAYDITLLLLLLSVLGVLANAAKRRGLL